MIIRFLVAFLWLVSAGFGRDSSRVDVGAFTVDAVQKEIRFKVKVAIKHGVLEFLLVGKQGKAYESTFKIMEGKPSDLHTALLLLGVKPVDHYEFREAIKTKMPSEGFRKIFPNSSLRVHVYRKGKGVPLDKLIISQEDHAIEDLWIFTGSAFTRDNRYMANTTFSYISVWPDVLTVINLYSIHGNPYEGGKGLRMRGDHPWKVGDDFELVIKPY